MAFDIVLYRNNSENICVTKNLSLIATVTGNLREETSLLTPSFEVEMSIADALNVNYIYVQAFGRYYYTRAPISVTTGIVRFECKVDPLMSFADEIKANTGIVRRGEYASTFNLYINDGSLVAYQNPYVLTEPFPNGFSGHSYILLAAGHA